MEIEYTDSGKSGIYRILNLLNNKCYVGSSISLYRRKHHHLWLAKKNKHKNPHLQASFNKYGINNFKFEVLEYCDRAALFIREQYWIDTLKPEYNMVLILVPNSFKWTPEMRKRHSERLKGRQTTAETRLKLSEAGKRWVRPKSLGRKISQTKKGKRLHPNSLKASRLSVIRAVIQLDKNNILIKEFESLTNAAKELGLFKANIQLVCAKKRGTCGGFIFRYKTENHDN